MSRTEPLALHYPDDLGQAVELGARLAAQGIEFAYLGGGSDLLPAIKLHGDKFGALISLNRLADLDRIGPCANEGLAIGARCRLAGLINDPQIRARAPALAVAAARVASPQIRNQATLGGNVLVDRRCIYYNQSETNRTAHGPCFKAGGEHCPLIKSVQAGDRPQCHARFVSDTVPVLLLMNAKARIASCQGERVIDLDAMYRPDGMNGLHLAPDDILTHIEIYPDPAVPVAYAKLAIRQTLDFPSLGVAMAREEDRLRIALTGVHTHPWQTSVDLAEHDSVPELLEEAAERAGTDIVTYNQDFFNRGYRKDMILVLIKRLAEKLWVAPEGAPTVEPT